MRTVLTLVAKDLRRRRANPVTTIVMLIFPVVFSLIIGLAFGGGGGGDGAKIPPIDVLLVDEDQSLAARFLTAASGRTGDDLLVRFHNVGREEGESLLARGKASALLVVPKGFTDRFLAGQPDTLLLRRNPAESFKPMIAGEFVNVTALLLSTAGTVFAEPIAAIRNVMDKPGSPPDETVAAIAVNVSHAIQSVTGYVDPPLVKLESTSPSKEEGPHKNVLIIALYILPGISVMTLLMVGQSAMRELLRERAAGTLRRTFAAPVTASQILASKFLSSAVMSGMALLVLALVGIAWHAPATDPLASVLLSAVFVLAIIGFNSLVYGFAKSERQGSTVGEIIIMCMAFMGGSWIPIESLPAAVRRIAPFTINYWAVDGYKRLIFDHAGLAALGRNVIVLAIIGIVGATVGTAMLRRRLMQGAS